MADDRDLSLVRCSNFGHCRVFAISNARARRFLRDLCALRPLFFGLGHNLKDRVQQIIHAPPMLRRNREHIPDS